MSDVDADWSTSPPTLTSSDSAWGSGTSSAVTSAGPIGANPSKLLPRVHCEVRCCQSRALTSLKGT
jgi:hypothetical protein